MQWPYNGVRSSAATEVVHEVQRDVTRFPRPANHPATLRSTGKEVAATVHTSFSTEPQTSPQVPSPCPPLHSRSHAPAPARLSLACAPEKGPAPLARHGVAFAHLQFHRHRCVARLLPIRLAVPSCCFERRPGACLLCIRLPMPWLLTGPVPQPATSPSKPPATLAMPARAPPRCCPRASLRSCSTAAPSAMSWKDCGGSSRYITTKLARGSESTRC